MILTSAEMKEQEEQAFRDGCTPESLMEEAGARIALAVRKFASAAGRCDVFFGKGNNGGDALVAARHLAEAGWDIAPRAAFPESAWTKLTKRKFQQLRESIGDRSGPEKDTSAALDKWPSVVIDAVLGLGAKGALRGHALEAARVINRIRSSSGAQVFSIDLPTGLDADTGAADPSAVAADFTLSIGFAKAGLLADAATAFTGRLAVLELPSLRFRGSAQQPWGEVADPITLGRLLPRRPFTMHKGECGRVAIIAGSAGFLGAAVLASKACVHAGAGLVTLYVTPDIYPLIAPCIAPEVMVHAVHSYLEVLDLRHGVLAVGPGLGQSRASEILQLIEKARQPMVVDADALNALAHRIDLLASCAGPRLLTPHPGEMARLLGKTGEHHEDNGPSRREIVESFTTKWPVTLLLKGSRTVIGEQGKPLSYNTTGNPGMATGGMGDVLTGVCAALAGQGLALYDAARIGAWICGRAAEIAVSTAGQSEESLSAGQIPLHLGIAFKDLRDGSW